jgi:hypothetical protein
MEMTETRKIELHNLRERLRETINGWCGDRPVSCTPEAVEGLVVRLEAIYVHLVNRLEEHERR